jgi:hypothetical protein
VPSVSDGPGWTKNETEARLWRVMHECLVSSKCSARNGK